MRIVPLLVVLSLFVGCAAVEDPVPQESYAGPTAKIVDTSRVVNSSLVEFYVLTEVNGRVVNNAIAATHRANFGGGFAISPRQYSRPVPVALLKLKLRASHETGAPIGNLLGAAVGEFQAVEGVVGFMPVEGRWYRVRGELKKEGSSVWLEDSETGAPVTAKVTSKQ
jgi:hypothetical protein